MLEPGRPEDRLDNGGVQRLVARRERVERGRDHERAVRIDALPDELSAREHGCLGCPHVGIEEVPRSASGAVGDVGADVAAPYRVGPRFTHGIREAGRLRSVEHDYVARADTVREVTARRPQRGLVQLAILCGVARGRLTRAVQVVVETFREPEELWVAVEHLPPRVDAGAAGVRGVRAHEHRDPSDARGRGDMPEGAVLESQPAALVACGELLPAHRIGDQRPEAVRIELENRDRGQCFVGGMHRVTPGRCYFPSLDLPSDSLALVTALRRKSY